MVSGAQSSSDKGFVGLIKVDEGHAHAPPSAVDGSEGHGLIGDERLLLLGGQLDDSVAFFLSGESREDAVVEAKVGMPHV